MGIEILHLSMCGMQKTLPVMVSSRYLARWLMHTFTSGALESNISSRDFIYIGDLPDSPDSSVYSPSTNESDKDDFD